MFKSKLLYGTTVLILFLLSDSSLAFRSVSVGRAAPTVVVQNLQGGEVQHSFGEQLEVLLFWRPHQTFSMDALRDLEKIYEEFSGKGVQVLVIAEGGSSPESVKTVVSDLELSYPVYLDPRHKMEEEYGVIVFPSSGIIGRDGRLKFYLPSRNSNYQEILRRRLEVELDFMTEEQFDRRMQQIGEELGGEQLRADDHRKAGQRLLRRGKSAEAVEELSQALVLDPESMSAHLSLGYAYLDIGGLEQARKEFEWVLEQHPASPGARVGLGIYTIRSGDLEEGIEMLEGAVVLNPDPVRGYYELGIAYEKKGDLTQALHAYHWAVKKLLQGRR